MVTDESEFFFGPVDLKDVLERLTFTEPTLPSAVLEQASLFMDATRFRIRKMRERQAAELELESKTAEFAIAIRLKASQVQTGKKSITEGYINQKLAVSPTLISLRKKLSTAEQLEEWAKSLQEALRMRRDMLNVYSRLATTEQEMRLKEVDTTGLERARRKLGKDMPLTEKL